MGYLNGATTWAGVIGEAVLERRLDGLLCYAMNNFGNGRFHFFDLDQYMLRQFAVFPFGQIQIPMHALGYLDFFQGLKKNDEIPPKINANLCKKSIF